MSGGPGAAGGPGASGGPVRVGTASVGVEVGELDDLLAAAVLARLPADGTPMPVLAAEVTGDTKALAGTTLLDLLLTDLAR